MSARGLNNEEVQEKSGREGGAAVQDELTTSNNE